MLHIIFAVLLLVDAIVLGVGVALAQERLSTVDLFGASFQASVEVGSALILFGTVYQ